MYPHPDRHKHPSCLLWMMWEEKKLFTGHSIYVVTTIQMNDQQQTADLLAELFGYPSLPERPLTHAVLSWKSSFLSDRASSVTNRRPRSYEMRACSTDVSCTLSFYPFTSTSKMAPLDLSKDQGCLLILWVISGTCGEGTWKQLHSVLTPRTSVHVCFGF